MGKNKQKLEAVEKLIKRMGDKMSAEEAQKIRDLFTDEPDDETAFDDSSNAFSQACCSCGGVSIGGVNVVGVNHGVICCNGHCGTTIKGNGKIKSRSFEFFNVETLSIDGPWEAELNSSAEADMCVVSMEENLFKYAHVKCTAGHLRIALTGNIAPTKPMRLKISLKNMPSKLTQAGACSFASGDMIGKSFEGDISGSSQLSMSKCHIDAVGLLISGSSHVSGKIAGTKGDFRVTGSSEVCLHCKLGTLGADVSGASDVDFDGEFKKVGLRVSGASRVRLAKAEACTIIVSGASNLRIHAKKSLEGSVSGASSVEYSGVKSHEVRTSGASDIYRA